MNITIKLAAYFLSKSPGQILSNSRLTALIYLCDWKYCLINNSPLTNIVWHNENNGPFSWQVIDDIIHERKFFMINKSLGAFISLNTSIKLVDYLNELRLGISEDMFRVMNFVNHQTVSLSKEELSSLVLSTYPIIRSKKFSDLNLKRLAIEYKLSRLWRIEAESLNIPEL